MAAGGMGAMQMAGMGSGLATGITQSTGGIITSILAGKKAKKAAQTAASIQQAGLSEAQNQLLQMYNQGLGFLSPYLNIGAAAGGTLSGLFVSPDEQLFQREQQRAALQSEIDALKANDPNSLENRRALQAMAQPGSNSGARYAQLLGEAQRKYRTQLTAAESRLKAFDVQTEGLKKRLESGPQSQEEMLASSPAYQFAAKQVNRQLAAQGLLGSEEAIRQHGGLAAQLTGIQSSNLQQLYSVGAGAAGQAANATFQTGGGLANFTAAQGQAGAQGALGVAQAEIDRIVGINNAVQQGVATFNQSVQNASSLGGGGGGQNPYQGSPYQSTSLNQWSQGGGNMSLGARPYQAYQPTYSFSTTGA